MLNRVRHRVIERPSRSLLLLRAGSLLSRAVPFPVLIALAAQLGRLVARVRPSLTKDLSSNLRRVRPEAGSEEIAALARDSFATYGRYWAETFRIPSLSPEALDQGFEVEGYEHLVAALDSGLGPIMVVPHLGGWEWAAAWLGCVDNRGVTAVVERLQPDDVFDWFKSLRQSFGVVIVALGSSAFGELLRAIRRGDILCILADRDIDGSGIDVEFFGHPTTMPAGPALLARRTGTVILPTAVYFKGDKRLCRIEPAIVVSADLPLREAISHATQQVATALEKLIDADPGQWHVLQPNWPE